MGALIALPLHCNIPAIIFRHHAFAIPQATDTMGESSASPLEVTPAWLESIDAVYALFEDPGLKNKFGDLAVKVQNAVKLCEQVVQELG